MEEGAHHPGDHFEHDVDGSGLEYLGHFQAGLQRQDIFQNTGVELPSAFLRPTSDEFSTSKRG